MKFYCMIFLSITLAFFCMSVTYGKEKIYLSEEDYLKLPEDQISIAESSLIFAKQLKSDIDIKRYLKIVNKMAGEIKSKVEKANTPEKKIKVINDYLFKKKKFQSVRTPAYGYLNGNKVSQKTYFFLNNVLDEKKGNCFGLSTLYLSLSERLGLSIYPVLTPAHIFVRYDDGDVRINIETLMSGVCVTDAEYISNKKIPQSSLDKQFYLKNINKKQFVATMINQRGNYYYYVLRDYRKAYEDFETANKGLKSPETYYNLSTVFFAQKKYDQAIESLMTVVELNENLWMAWANLAKCYQEIGKINEAIICCNKAIILSDDTANIYATRASCYLKISEVDKAIEDYNRVQEIDPDFVIHFNNLALAYAMKGDLSKAIEVISSGILKEPNNAMYYHLRSMFYTDKNDFDAFIKDAKIAVKMVPALKEKIRGNPRFNKWREKKAFQELFK